MDNWKLNQSFNFTRKMHPFGYKGELLSVCGAEWMLGFKNGPFFEVHLQCDHLNQQVLVNMYVHNSQPQPANVSIPEPQYYSNNKLCQEFTPNKKKFIFRYNSNYGGYDYFTSGSQKLLYIFIKVEFFTLKHDSTIQAEVVKKSITGQFDAVMDNWKLKQSFNFMRKLPFPNIYGELLSVCGTVWQLTFTSQTFLDINLQCDHLDQHVLVNLYVHNSQPQPGIISIHDPYYYSNTKLCHEFTPDEKKYIFRYNLDYDDYPLTLENVRHSDICIKVEFFSLKHDSSLVNVAEKSVIDEVKKPCEDSSDGDSSDDIISNLEQILVRRDFSDVTIRCGEQCFNVHKVILCGRSPVFATMLHSNMKESQTGEINIEDVNPEVMQDLLTYIYTGKHKQTSFEITCGTLVAADKYMLTGLKKSCVKILRSSITEDNALNILVLADLHDEELKKAVLQFVCSKYSLFSNSLQWKYLRKENQSLIIDIMAAEIKFLGGKSK